MDAALPLASRVAVVTGASRGLGRAIALRLASEGASIVVNSATSAQDGEAVVGEILELGGRAIYAGADVRDFDGVKGLARTAREGLGPVSILVNNAGWMEPRPFHDNDEAFWSRVFDTKVRGALHAVWSLLPQMRDVGWGKIVTITGDSGRVGMANMVVHTGAQGALQSMTKSWAREFAPYGIRVNAVSPGPIETKQQKDFTSAAPDIAATDHQGPFGVGRPEDIAAAVAFFVRPEGDHVTGQILSVNGGRAYPS